MTHPIMADDKWNELMEGIARTQYQLLIGAGMSLDVTDRRGRRLPGGRELAVEIAKTFSVPGDPRGNLRQVVALAKTKKSSSGQSLIDFMAERFSRTTPPDWYRDLVALPWRYIWSLNIDDAVENAYRFLYAEHAMQKLTSVSWTDSHRLPKIDQVVMVHLHGVAWAKKVDDLVFDISSYVYAVQQRHRWHSIFADSYVDTPTIVLGASLSDEFDLESVLERGRASGAGIAPSIVVSPDIDEFDAARYESFGLIPVRTTAQDFLARVRAAWPQYAQSITPADVAGELVSPMALKFLHQWRLLDFKAVRGGDPKHDFYGGHEPRMSDVQAGMDADRVISAEIQKELSGPATRRVVGLTGTPFTGKSTVALRVARNLSEQDWKVYAFDPEFRPDVESVLWWCRHFPRTLLLVEGAADFAPDLRVLAEEALKRDWPVHMLLVERKSRIKELYRNWDADVLVEKSMAGRLQKNEAGWIIRKLTDATRLGVLTGKDHKTAVKFFMSDHKGELFSAMSALEGADGFRSRFATGYRQLDVYERTVFHAVCITATLGYGLPFGAAVAVSGVTPATLNSFLASDSVLSDFVYLVKARLQPRHRVFGSSMMDALFTRDENFERTLDLARHLGAQVSPAAISVRSFAYRLVRQLLDHEILERWIGASRVDTWYEQAEEVYSWNSRFWEQRALAASNRGRFAPASSWARHAVELHPDALSLNTLATVLLRKDLAESAPEARRPDGFLEASGLLQEARVKAAEDSEYPYITFFEYTLSWAERWLKAHGSIDNFIIRQWNDWKYLADNSRAFAYAGGRQTLEEFHTRWLKLGL